MLRNLWWVTHGHILVPFLCVTLLCLPILDHDGKLRGVDVRQLGTVAIASTNNSLLIVIVVCTREEVTKGKFWIPNTFLFVHTNTDATERPIVFNRDGTSLLVYPRRDKSTALRME